MGKQKLTRKELVEHIRQVMPSNLSEIERLAFIETEIAKQISFNEQYLWGDRETKEKIYKLSKMETQRPQKQVKRKLICITMSELLGYVLKKLGFEVVYHKSAPGQQDKIGEDDIFKKVSPKKQEHVCTIVRLSNGDFLEVDIQSDLYRLQTHSRPKAFGQDSIQLKNGLKSMTIDNSEISKIFKKVYQLKESEKFTDEYILWFSLMLKCEEKSPMETLEFFINNPRIQEELQNTRCTEAYKLYKKVLSSCYNASIRNMFFNGRDTAIIQECILSDFQGLKRYSFCIYTRNEEEQQLYVYSKKSRRMVKLNQKEMQHISQQFGKIQLRGRSSELREQMLMFINGASKEDDNSKNDPPNVFLQEMFFDEDEEVLE